MNRHELLAALHTALEPRSYLEIGVNHGVSLALSRTRTIGIDPAFHVDVDLACDLQLARATSDDFFARPNPIAWLTAGVIDLALIDGLHVFEYALRDFINIEKHSSPNTVVVFDDMLPRTIPEAARNRITMNWAGDVYNVATVLERYRPDLTVIGLDTDPTGVVIVVGLDPTNTTLTEHYDQILAEFITPDPQNVPADLLHRRHAADPNQVIAAGVWNDILTARPTGTAATTLTTLRALRGNRHLHLQPPTRPALATPTRQKTHQKDHPKEDSEENRGPPAGHRHRRHHRPHPQGDQTPPLALARDVNELSPSDVGRA